MGGLFGSLVRLNQRVRTAGHAPGAWSTCTIPHAQRAARRPQHTMNETPGISYRDAGVDIDAGDELVERIKPLVRRSQRPEVLAGIGGFGALVELPVGRYQRPVLVSGTDGVGHQAAPRHRHRPPRHHRHRSGRDVRQRRRGAGRRAAVLSGLLRDGQASSGVAEAVIRGIVEGCTQAGAALVGGETAEMPGMYHGEDYDLAGFCVGVVEKDAIIDGRNVSAGDAVIGLSSSGPHSNGYSLIRKIVSVAGADLAADLEGRPLGDRLLAPTRIYVKPLLELIRTMPVHGLAHITGGGLTDNIPRVLPEGLEVVLPRRSWHRDPTFEWLQRQGRIEPAEMYRTFNCGIGMVAIVPADQADAAIRLLKPAGEIAQVIGEVRKGGRGVLIQE